MRKLFPRTGYKRNWNRRGRMIRKPCVNGVQYVWGHALIQQRWADKPYAIWHPKEVHDRM